MSGPIGRLPKGASATPCLVPQFRGPWCNETRPDLEGAYCWRPKGHEGRHVDVVGHGSVYAVWGEDVYAETRARGKAELVKKQNQRLERVVDLIGFGVDPEDAWGAVEKVAAAHRPPCIDGSVCGESAHCPPEDGAR